jgi:cytoskeleton protein RodZ
MTKITQISLGTDGSGSKDSLSPRRIHLREISGDSESPLETVGQDLRAARLRRGDEIAAVSRALKIRKDHLEALENDRMEDLPGKTYAIGFIRSYARHLGLDAELYVERIKRDISGRAEEQSREPAPIHSDDRRLPMGWRIVAGAVALLLIAGGWHLLSSNSGSNQPVPPAPVLSPPKPALAAARPVPPPQAPSVAPATPSVINGAVSDPAKVAAQPAATAKPPVAPAPVQAAALPAVPGAGQVYGAKNRNPRVILRVRGDSRVTVRDSDGQILLNRDLKRGDSYQVPNLPGVTLATDDGSAVEVDVDGVAMGRAGKPQEVLGRVSLEPQSLSDRFNNH